MPDEALKASLQGRPRQAPDFSLLALSHLHDSCLAVRQLIKQYLTTGAASQLSSVRIAIKEIHNTLQLLDRNGALMVTSEILSLLDAVEEGAINDTDACAHSLVFAGERLADYIAHLQRPGAIDSALPLLPVINNCRACRGEELMSEMLVVASGIDLPDASNLELPSTVEIHAFISSVKSSRKPMMSGLVGWFTDEAALQGSLSELEKLFANLSSQCEEPTSLQPLSPLFDSAEFICYSVRRGGLESSAAVHRIFAQLERLLDSYTKLDHNDRQAFAKPVPAHLFLNLLYYVALSSETSPKAVVLRRRFRLDRFMPRGISSEHTQVSFDGVGDRLANSIRDAIEKETESAREWLDDSNRSPVELQHIYRQLVQLEPAIKLLGTPESLRHLSLVNGSLQKFVVSGSALDQRTTEHTADALVRLERALNTELNATRNCNASAQHSDLDSMLMSCLTEAQLRLLEIEEDLIVLFGESSDRLSNFQLSERQYVNRGGQHQRQISAPVKVAEINAKLSMVNSALQILPLPEVSPLIVGIQAFVQRNESQPLTHSAHRSLATVMVSLGYYLNSVLQPNGAAGQLLLEAEEAMLALDLEGQPDSDDTVANAALDVTQLINGRTANSGLIGNLADSGDATRVDRPSLHVKQRSNDADFDDTIVDYTLDTEAEGFVDVSLQQITIINTALFEYEQANADDQQDLRDAHKETLKNAFSILAYEARACDSADLVELTNANIRLLESGNDSEKALSLLQESVAVLPQLINQMHSSSDSVYGLQALLDQLHDAAQDDITLAVDVQNILSANSTIDDDTHLLDEDQAVSDTTDEVDEDNTVAVDRLDEIAPLNIEQDMVLGADDEFDDTAAITELVGFDTQIETQAVSGLSGVQLDNAYSEDTLDDTVSDLTSDASSNLPIMTLDNTLEQVFYRECDQHLLSLRQSVNAALTQNNWGGEFNRSSLEIDKTSALPNRDMLRALHTLTGSAQTVDAQELIAIAQPLQKAALLKQRNGEYFDRSETEYIGELLDILQARIDAMESDSPYPDDNDAVMQRLNAFVARSEPWVPERQEGLELNDDVASIESVFQQESRELLVRLRVESQRLSDDEQRSDAIEQIFNRLHTIKGSARMAGQTALADRAHELEDEIRLADGALLDEAVSIGLSELQTLMLVDVPTAPKPDLAVVRSEPKRPEPMGITEASFENMLSLATRATVSQAKLGESLIQLRDACQDIENSAARLQRLPHEHPELQTAAVQEMLSDLDSAQRMLADALLDAEAEQTHGSRADTSLQQTLIRAQLVSFAESHTRLAHAVADAANQTNKQVTFNFVGGELNIDKAIHRKLMTPLEHLLRNAVVHGIEAAAERRASGKVAEGAVTVDAKIDGTDLLIEVSDDGLGIRSDSVIDSAAHLSSQHKSKANKSSSPQSKNVSSNDILNVLCEPGFSTREVADQLGGRGLGLSTVKQVVEELNGTMQLNLPAQGGSVFSLRIPQMTRTHQVVLVEHQSRLLAIPVNFIHTVSDEQVDQHSGDIQFNGNDYSSCSLDAILNGNISSTTVGAGLGSSVGLILIGVHNKHIALMVDKVVGYREVIAQPLGEQFTRLQRYLGGAVLADGRQVLIPDFNRLLSAETELPVRHWEAANAPVRAKTALIVDDSITMRIAAEQMLHDMKIAPSLARDGAEAVEIVSEFLPDILLVDIDMPRMNGFDFLQHLSILHPEHSVPIVMISTRDTDADRQRAKSLGAEHYLVKPYTKDQLQNVLDSTGILG